VVYISEEKVFLNWYFNNYLLKSKNDSPILYVNTQYTGSLTAIKEEIIKDTLVDVKHSYEDNEIKEAFYSCFVKEVGLPYSQKIREKSEQRSKVCSENRNSNIILCVAFFSVKDTQMVTRGSRALPVER
jgi:hypothetical protein